MVRDLIETLQDLLKGLFFCAAVVFFITLSFLACAHAIVIPYRESTYTVTGTLIDYDCVKPYFRCYDRFEFKIDGETTHKYFHNENDFFFKSNSDEIYNSLQVGHRYELTVTGPFDSNPILYITGLATSDNIISAKEIEDQ